MPIYEYKCRVCDQNFEVEQSFTDETLTEIDGCPVDESGRHQVKKVFAAPAIAFKGDGFYRNDARSSTASSKSADDASPSEKSSDKSSAASTESASTSDSSTTASTASSSSSSNGDKASTSSSSSSSSSGD